MFDDIKGRGQWERIEAVSGGWSSDRKYLIETKEQKLLLRVAGAEQYQAKKKEMEVIEKFSKLGFPMSRPAGFGLCDGGRNVYMLLTWVEGVSLEEALPELPEAEQARLGREAGTILKKIHSIPVEAGDLPRETRKAKKLAQLALYEQSKARIEGDEAAIQYVKGRIDLIGRRKPVYLHGDFHPGNLIYREDGSLGLIDFNRWKVGDPYEEFYKLQSFGVELSVPFCAGLIDAYFDGHIPDGFWETLAVYAAHASLYSIKWAEDFGQQDVVRMTARCRRALDDYDGFQRTIPKWYTGEQYRDTM